MAILDFKTKERIAMNNVARGSQVALAASQLLKEKAYWVEKFSGDLMLSHFPYDFTGDGQEPCRRVLDINFQQQQINGLIKLGNHSHRRLHMVLTTIAAVLMNKYTGNQDIVLGTTVEKQDFDGEFINTILPLRTAITPTTTFKELLLQVRETILQAAENQNYPMETLLHDLGLNQDQPTQQAGGQQAFPLFDTAVLMENIHEIDYLQSIAPNMIFLFTSDGDQLEGRLQYNDTKYNKETVQQFITHFKRLTDIFLEDLNKPVADAQVLTSEEQKRILVDFNNFSPQADQPHIPYPPKTISLLFEEQVQQGPDNLALTFEDEDLTYFQLNERVNRLAHLLREKGVQPDTIVGLMAHRSLELVVGLLAILKAGGAYVPLPPGNPKERIMGQIKDSNVKLVLTDNNLDIENQFDGQLIDIQSASLTGSSQFDPHSINQPHDLAYIMYTSGSTGKPKGVAVQHDTIANTLQWRKQYYRFDINDVILQVPSYAFDSSVEDILTPLISGSRLILFPENRRLDLPHLGDLIEKYSVTHFLIIPNLYQAFLKEIPTKLKGLRSVTAAGDHFTSQLIKTHFQELPQVALFNEYGPAENSVCSTAYSFDNTSKQVLIGTPINRVSCFILDKDNQLQPIGVPGQICLAGAGLTRGYINRPELTNEKFITSPQAQEANLLAQVNDNRLYCTGDMARWLPGGNIQFLGRVDHQVKIRGVRIELGEIENHLLKIDNIKEAVVIAKEDNLGDKFLCAYIVLTDKESQLETATVNGRLRADLPEYLVPHHFIQLLQMPLTTTGKIDRRKLPDPEIMTDSVYTAPRNPLETQLVEIWAEELNVEAEKIGIDTSFFQLGGHSLKATSLISRVHKSLNVEVPLLELFREPTVRGLAAYIENCGESRFMAIEPAPQMERYPLSSAQYRLYILQQMDAHSTAYNLPEIRFFKEALDKDCLESAFKTLIQRHESLRTAIVTHQGQLYQQIHEQVPFEVQYNTVTKAEARDLLNYFVKPFELDKAPYLRVAQVEIVEAEKANSWALVVDMHHIISDEVSLEILLRDFMAIYDDRQLPPLRLQYKDYAYWQNQQKKSETIDKQRDFWLNVFTGDVPVLQMPTDFDRPAKMTFTGNTITQTITGTLHDKLKEKVNQWDVTYNFLMQAAYYVLLSKYTGQEDIVVGNVVAGRKHADLDQIIGFFVNMIALRNQPIRTHTFAQFLTRVKENALNAYDNQDFPFEELVGALDLKREAGRHPLVDTVFVVQNVAAQFKTDEKKDADSEIIETLKRSHFDLMLHATVFQNRVNLVLEYSTSLFKKATAEEMLKCYIDILAQVVQNNNIPLKDISLAHDYATPQANVLQEKEVDFDF
jgi:amino acid adenylation domain-containing protein